MERFSLKVQFLSKENPPVERPHKLSLSLSLQACRMQILGDSRVVRGGRGAVLFPFAILPDTQRPCRRLPPLLLRVSEIANYKGEMHRLLLS